MPHLNLLRDPVPNIITLSVWMPPENSTTRWTYQIGLYDADGRGCGSGSWNLSPREEPADLGHVMRETYDAWFNGSAHQVMPAAERALRRYSR